MSFEPAVIAQVVDVAKAHDIEAQALLAVVEVESAGKSLEIDGKTPCLLFERHVFYRELKKAKKLTALDHAVASGLAIPKWSPKTQYKDQGTSAQRLSLFARAKAIDEECANRSCSWGVGQTCGFLAEELRFPNANAMMAYMTAGGVPAQVECMVREIENKKLSLKLNLHQWAAFAKVYNGPGYAQNSYDVKMASAYLKWSRQNLPAASVPAPVRVPTEMRPSLPPPPPKVTPKQATVGGIAAVVAAIATFMQTAEFKLIAFGALILALAIITAVVLWRRHAAQTDRGTLASVSEF